MLMRSGAHCVPRPGAMPRERREQIAGQCGIFSDFSPLLMGRTSHQPYTCRTMALDMPNNWILSVLRVSAGYRCTDYRGTILLWGVRRRIGCAQTRQYTWQVQHPLAHCRSALCA